MLIFSSLGLVVLLVLHHDEDVVAVVVALSFDLILFAVDFNLVKNDDVRVGTLGLLCLSLVVLLLPLLCN